jgi:hypothetical protein
MSDGTPYRRNDPTVMRRSSWKPPELGAGIGAAPLEAEVGSATYAVSLPACHRPNREMHSFTNSTTRTTALELKGSLPSRVDAEMTNTATLSMAM